MEDTLKSNQPVNISKILKQSFSLYKENFLLFIGIAFLGYAVGLLDAVLRAIFENAYTYGWISLIAVPLGFLISIWASVALIIAVSNRYLNNVTTWKQCFIEVKGKYWRFIVITALYILISGAGILLLVIPGIYWGTIFCLATVAVVLEKRKDIGPLKISKELVRGDFWKIFLLGLIILVVSSPLHIILFNLTKTNRNVAIILMQIFPIFYVSFTTVVGVTLYHNLKEKKKDRLPLETGGATKKGKGCLGCLGAIGLVFLIIVASLFWMVGVIELLQTKKGAQVSENIKKKISPEITFPGNITLERPKGSLVMKKPGKEVRYELWLFGNKKIVKLGLWAIHVENISTTKASLSLDSQVIGDGILGHTIRKSKMTENWFKDYKPQPVRIITLGGRSWGEYTLQETKEVGGTTRVAVWKNVYTIVGDYVLIASYGYRSKKDRTVVSKEELLKEEKEIRNIIASFRFSER